MRILGVILSFACVPLLAHAQRPLAHSATRAAARASTPYPLDSAYAFGADSIVLVLRDQTLTQKRQAAGTWMFGPPATKAEADGCPPEKVLGRRIARATWAALDKPKGLKFIMVRVRGPWDGDPLLSRTQLVEDFYYSYEQLAGPWIGDSSGGTAKVMHARR